MAKQKQIVIPEKLRVLPLFLGIGLLLMAPVAGGVGYLLAINPPLCAAVPTLLAIWPLSVFLRQIILKPRLVLARESLQLRQGASRVVGQLPYVNILRTEIMRKARPGSAGDERSKAVLEVLVVLRGHLETYWPGMKDEDEEGYDIEIEPVYTIPLSQLRVMLFERVEMARRKLFNEVDESKRRRRGDDIPTL